MTSDSEKLQRIRRSALIVEFTALAILVISMYALAQGVSEPLTAADLLLPAVASAFVLGGFLVSLYARWRIAMGRLSLLHQGLFGLLCLALSVTWVYAIMQTWRSLGQA